MNAVEVRFSSGVWVKIEEQLSPDASVVGVYTDITEVKRREAELADLVDHLTVARDQAMEATRAKSQFLANMSHELRTPLNAVIGITEMLEEDVRDDALDDYIEPLARISGAGKHLLHLINEVLDLSKVEAGRMELHLEDIDVAWLIDMLATTAQPLADKNGNRLTIHCPGDCGAIHADLMRVRQIMLNLLSNACKFTESGEVTLTVARQKGRRQGLDPFRGRGHRHRHDPRPTDQVVSGILAGRQLHHPKVRRHGARSRHQQTAVPHDGRRHRSDERAGGRQHVHGAAAGDGGHCESERERIGR